MGPHPEPLPGLRIATGLAALDAQVVECRRCPRLVEWREEVARVKRASYAAESYWGRPVPGFGSRAPLIWVVGLAPAAHGANRTGRMFTGDRSGDWLFASLHRVGLATRPTSVRIDDGQELRGVRLTAAVHCAPPGNKPTPEEFSACAGWLRAELALVEPTVLVVVALGGLAWSSVLAAVRAEGWQVPRPAPRFGHGAEVVIGSAGRGVVLLGAYHPSQQNTFTGRLTEPMLDAVLGRAAQVAGS
ncbi:MAG: uracil-DNA glycosylase [Candidatus Nanopelagicales bacterium]